MSKSFLRSQRIRLLTISFFCKLWDSKHSSEGGVLGGGEAFGIPSVGIYRTSREAGQGGAGEVREGPAGWAY